MNVAKQGGLLLLPSSYSGNRGSAIGAILLRILGLQSPLLQLVDRDSRLGKANGGLRLLIPFTECSATKVGVSVRNYTFIPNPSYRAMAQRFCLGVETN